MVSQRRDMLGKDLKKLLSQFADPISKLVDFGRKMIIADVKQAKGTDDERLVAPSLLRNLIGLGDALAILIEQSSIEPCQHLLRSLLECSFNLQYLLQEDTAKRSQMYRTYHAMNRLKLLNRYDSQTKIGNELKTSF